MSSKGGSATLADAAKALGDLLAPGAKLGMELLGSIALPSRGCGCGCEIPPPCWAPQPLGEVTTEACPGNEGLLRFTITNCGMTGRTIKVAATNAAVKVAARLADARPAGGRARDPLAGRPGRRAKGQTQKSLVWIHGCKTHYLRWTVVVAESGVSCGAD